MPYKKLCKCCGIIFYLSDSMANRRRELCKRCISKKKCAKLAVFAENDKDIQFYSDR